MNIINLITSINWISVFEAFVAYSLLGALWFMLFFPKVYRVSLGRDPNVKTSESAIFIAGPALCALLITITCAILMQALQLNSYGEVIQFVLIVGVGYLFANTVNIGINPNIPRPLLYGMITGMYHLLGMVFVNSILYFAK